MANKATKTGLGIASIGCLMMILPLVLLMVGAFILTVLAMLGSI